jgi:hypothetical protein
MIVRDAVVFAMNGCTQLTYMNSCEQTCSAALPTVLAAFEHVPSLLHIRQPIVSCPRTAPKASTLHSQSNL